MSEEYTSVRITNVNKEANEDIISSCFSFCGEIKSIEIRDSSPDANEAIITFGTHDAAKMAEVLTNTVILDKNIEVTPYFHGDQAERSDEPKAPEEPNSTAEETSILPGPKADGKKETESTPSNSDTVSAQVRSAAAAVVATECATKENSNEAASNNDDDNDDDDDDNAKKETEKKESEQQPKKEQQQQQCEEEKTGKESGVVHVKLNKNTKQQFHDHNNVCHHLFFFFLKVLGGIMADGYLAKEDLKKSAIEYDKALGLSEGIKSSAAAVDNTLGLSSAFSAASSFVSTQFKEIDQQTGLSQAAGSLMGEVSESPYFASAFSMFRGWGASITKAYNAVCKESTSIIEEKKAADSASGGQQQQELKQ